MFISEMKKNKLKCCDNKNSSYEKLIKLSDFLELISDKNRLRIVCMLSLGEKCVCEIYEHLDLSQNLTSYHLKALEKEKIVFSDKRGVKVFYRLNDKKMKNSMKSLNNFLNIHE